MRIVVVIISSQQSEEGTLKALFAAAREVSQDANISAWYICDDGMLPPEPQDGDILVCKFKKNDVYCAEAILPVLEELYTRYIPDMIIMPADSVGNELAARLACRIGVACMTDVCGFSEIEEEKKRFLYKPAYNAALKAKFEYLTPIFITVKISMFEAYECYKNVPGSHKITWIEIQTFDVSDIYCEAEMLYSEDEPVFAEATRIVAIGRGIGTREKAKEAAIFAESINAMIGGSRPAVIDGWVPFSRQIGMSGKIVKPDICIVLGASGAQAFATGIKSSKNIIGVNTDEKAAIFRICDIGVVCDAGEFLTAIAELCAGKAEWYKSDD